jgi:HAD superfamily hydrolase (TIGR01450 family)
MRGVLIDRDGVLMYSKEGELVPGACEFVSRLKCRGIPFLIATNHSTSSIESASEILHNSGFPVSANEMHTPLVVLEQYLKDRNPGYMYVRGTSEFKEYLRSSGYLIKDDSRVDVVLLAFDQTMNYDAVSIAITAILENKADLIAMHENRIFRSFDGSLEPGLGVWVRAVEYATGAKAHIMGKPSAGYYSVAVNRLGSLPEETVMISDDPLGDLTGAKMMGIKTIFVLSGLYSDISVLDRLDPGLRPDLIRNSIADITMEDLG